MCTSATIQIQNPFYSLVRSQFNRTDPCSCHWIEIYHAALLEHLPFWIISIFDGVERRKTFIYTAITLRLHGAQCTVHSANRYAIQEFPRKCKLKSQLDSDPGFVHFVLFVSSLRFIISSSLFPDFGSRMSQNIF